MLKKYSIIIICISTLFAFNAHAQAPGYRGKKLNLTYDFNFYHNLFKYLHLGEILGNVDTWTAPRPTIKNGLGIEYVIGRHSSIVANTSVFFSKIPIKNNFSYTDNTSWFGFSNDQTLYLNPLDETKIFAYNIGVHYRAYYKNKGLAPLGNFFDIGIERISYKLTVSDQMAVSDYYYYDPYNIPSSYVSSSTIPYTLKNWNNAYLVNVGLGSQRVVYNNFTFRYGVKLGWIIGSALNELNTKGGLDLTENDYFNYNAINHLWNKNFLQLDVGVGYLIK